MLLKMIKDFFMSILLKLKILFAKHVPMADALYDDFVNSDEGKKIVEELKKTADKNATIKSITNLLTGKAEELAEKNPELTKKILDYLEQKILDSLE